MDCVIIHDRSITCNVTIICSYDCLTKLMWSRGKHASIHYHRIRCAVHHVQRQMFTLASSCGLIGLGAFLHTLEWLDANRGLTSSVGFSQFNTVIDFVNLLGSEKCFFLFFVSSFLVSLCY